MGLSSSLVIWAVDLPPWALFSPLISFPDFLSNGIKDTRYLSSGMVVREGVPKARRGLDTFAKSCSKVRAKAGASLNLATMEVNRRVATGVGPLPGSPVSPHCFLLLRLPTPSFSVLPSCLLCPSTLL